MNNTIIGLNNDFAKDMNDMKLAPEKAVELAVQAASSCTNPNDVLLTIREVYLTLTRGRGLLDPYSKYK